MRESNWLRRAVESLVHLGERLEKEIHATHDANEAQHETWKKIESNLSEMRLPEKERVKAEAYNQKNYRLQRILTIGTWLAFAAGAVYAGIAAKQLKTMNSTYEEMREQTYVSCINAQAAQATFLEALRSSSDTHAASMATIQEAAISNDSQKAKIDIGMGMPSVENFVNRPLGIPYIIKNEGKSSAVNLKFWITAVMLDKGQKLVINNRLKGHDTFKSLEAGARVPAIPEDPSYHAFENDATLFDYTGKMIQPNSRQATDFIAGGTTTAFVYGRYEYADITGKHSARFCVHAFKKKPGEITIQDENDKTCFYYITTSDEYRGTASVAAEPPRINIAPIACQKPTD